MQHLLNFKLYFRAVYASIRTVPFNTQLLSDI